MIRKIAFQLSTTPIKISISLSKGAGLDEGTIKAVWPHLTEAERAQYLKDNPDSKAHKFPKSGDEEGQDKEQEKTAKSKSKSKPKSDTADDESAAVDDDADPESKSEVETDDSPQKKEGSDDDETEPKSNKKSKSPKKDVDEDDEDLDDDADQDPKSKSKSKGRGKHRDDDDSDEKDNWWEKLNADEQDAYLKRHPKSTRRKTHANGVTKHVMMLASNEVHKHVKALGKNYRWGMKGIRALRSGQPMTPGQKQGLKKTAAVVAGLALVAVAGLALFTPLGGMAMEIGEEYIKHLQGQNSGEASASAADEPEDKNDAATLDEFQQGLTAWLVKQDPKELAARLIKAKKEQQ
jgi:hypothetical protein